MRKTTTFLALALLALTAPVARAGDATPWLGVYTQTVDARLREALDLTSDGALISNVVDGSPAEQAGLRKGDIVLRFAGQPVRSSDELVERVRESSVGQTVTIEVRRGDTTRTFTTRLGARPAGDTAPDAGRRITIDAPDRDRRVIVRRKGDGAAPKAERRMIIRRPGHEDIELEGDEVDGFDWQGMRGLERLRDLPGMKGLHGITPGGPGGIAMAMGRGRLGVRVQDLNDQLGEYFEVPDGRGALVMEVMKDTPAERAGLQAGDIITKVGEQSIDDSSDLIETLRGKEGKVTVMVVRKGRTLTLEPELGQATPRRSRIETEEDRLAPRAPESHEDLGALREELRELRQQMRELRRELETTRR